MKGFFQKLVLIYGSVATQRKVHCSSHLLTLSFHYSQTKSHHVCI
uniref:Uncharacterized protein n=1 Tax=Brassica oleracea TaxID=3712 RepID=A0A3P6AXM1_BRAOL|nr:unnamed protein product [Brassica oleracea]